MAEKLMKKMMMVQELSEAMYRYNQTVTDPIARIKARALSALILEGLISSNDDEEEPQQIGEKRESLEVSDKLQEELTKIAKAAADARAFVVDTILKQRQTREDEKKETTGLTPIVESKKEEVPTQAKTKSPMTVILSAEEPYFIALQPIESKKEEVTLPSTHTEDRASAFVTDEPEEQAQTQNRGSKLSSILNDASFETTTDEEGRFIPVLHIRKECLEAAQMKRAGYDSHLSRMMRNYHHCRWYPQHQEAATIDNPTIKLSDLLDSAEQIREGLVLNYIVQIAQQIANFPRTRSTSLKVRPIDIDLIPVIEATLISKGYRCLVKAQEIYIGW